MNEEPVAFSFDVGALVELCGFSFGVAMGDAGEMDGDGKGGEETLMMMIGLDVRGNIGKAVQGLGFLVVVSGFPSYSNSRITSDLKIESEILVFTA